MIQRCTNPRLKKYERYGARGIKVCDRWLKFENFFADMGRKVAGASIERQDNDGHYEPGNCVWSNPKQQARNRSTTKWVLLDGKRMTITEASVAIGLGELAVSKRLKRGWPIERALDGRGLWAAQ